MSPSVTKHFGNDDAITVGDCVRKNICSLKEPTIPTRKIAYSHSKKPWDGMSPRQVISLRPQPLSTFQLSSHISHLVPGCQPLGYKTARHCGLTHNTKMSNQRTTWGSFLKKKGLFLKIPQKTPIFQKSLIFQYRWCSGLMIANKMFFS